jgi:hypothetical protein
MITVSELVRKLIVILCLNLLTNKCEYTFMTHIFFSITLFVAYDRCLFLAYYYYHGMSIEMKITSQVMIN